jgi:hypothetical protein
MWVRAKGHQQQARVQGFARVSRGSGAAISRSITASISQPESSAGARSRSWLMNCADWNPSAWFAAIPAHHPIVFGERRLVIASHEDLAQFAADDLEVRVHSMAELVVVALAIDGP